MHFMGSVQKKVADISRIWIITRARERKTRWCLGWIIVWDKNARIYMFLLGNAYLSTNFEFYRRTSYECVVIIATVLAYHVCCARFMRKVCNSYVRSVHEAYFQQYIFLLQLLLLSRWSGGIGVEARWLSLSSLWEASIFLWLLTERNESCVDA